jgi:hypothetical protein
MVGAWLAMSSHSLPAADLVGYVTRVLTACSPSSGAFAHRPREHGHAQGIVVAIGSKMNREDVGSNPHAFCRHQPAALATMAVGSKLIAQQLAEEHQQKVEARAKAAGGPSAASGALPGPDLEAAASGALPGPAEAAVKAPPSKKGDVGYVDPRFAGPLPAELMATDEQDRRYHKTIKKIVKANIHLSRIKRVCTRYTTENACDALAKIREELGNMSDSEDEGPAVHQIILPKDQVTLLVTASSGCD